MGRIAIPSREMIESLRDNPELRYAAKYPIESHLGFEGIWQCDQYRNGELISGGYPETRNTFTTEGMARLLNIIFHDISKPASEIWYVGIYKNNITPSVGNTAATCLGAAGTYGECQDADYDNPATNKPAYTTADTETASITNSVAGKAEFTMAASITIYGAFLSTEAAKTATTGYLMCAKKFSSSRAVIDDDVLYVTYTISATTS
ncbi:MAG: hypothetical protein JRI80_04905 [Deltaproteobacteria bacterium]|nr:hypothetical protein [Deltaproteobacteria bacterium]